mmetsp:Transcript_13245/g.31456  ORF Transcript_13245/g.31456 Transcript_13245/m.31456 type:complete len:391 (-) Transcript_13245:3270-4442(-)
MMMMPIISVSYGSEIRISYRYKRPRRYSESFGGSALVARRKRELRVFSVANHSRCASVYKAVPDWRRMLSISTPITSCEMKALPTKMNTIGNRMFSGAVLVLGCSATTYWLCPAGQPSSPSSPLPLQISSVLRGMSMSEWKIARRLSWLSSRRSVMLAAPMFSKLFRAGAHTRCTRICCSRKTPSALGQASASGSTWVHSMSGIPPKLVPIQSSKPSADKSLQELRRPRKSEMPIRPKRSMRMTRRLRTWRMETKLLISAATRFLTVEKFFCIGRTIRTSRIVLNPPRLIPFGNTSIIMMQMNVKSRMFQPPSSVLEKNGGFPAGNSMLVYGGCAWEKAPNTNILAKTSHVKKARRERSISWRTAGSRIGASGGSTWMRMTEKTMAEATK